MVVRVAIEDPSQPEIIQLLRDGEDYSAGLYPPESNHHLSLDELRASNVQFFVGRDNTGRALATGALVLHGSWGELKRMWVVPNSRGQGVSKAILAALESAARREGVAVLRLETGVANHAALAFYANAQFERRGPFGEYRADPLSVFMEKKLLPRGGP
jgi:putative acetyltransferase